MSTRHHLLRARLSPDLAVPTTAAVPHPPRSDEAKPKHHRDPKKKTMPVPTSERVKKFRAKKLQTQQGRNDMKAKNRLYKARSRRKSDIRRLADQVVAMKAGLGPAQVRWIDGEAVAHRVRLLRKASAEGRKLTKDDELEVDVDVMRRQVEMLKAIERQKVLDDHITEGDLPKLDDQVSSATPLSDAGVRDPFEVTSSESPGEGTPTKSYEAVGGDSVVEATRDDLMNVLCALGLVEDFQVHASLLGA